METENKKTVGVAITGSFCTHEKIKETLRDLKAHGWACDPGIFGKCGKARYPLWKSGGFCGRSTKDHRGTRDFHDSGGGAGRAEKAV